MRGIKSRCRGVDAKVNFVYNWKFVSGKILRFFPTRSFTKSIAVPVFAIAMLETGMTPSSASWHRPPADVVAAASRRHARSLSMFAPRLNLDADYYANGTRVSTQSRRRCFLQHPASRRRRNPPFPGSTCAKKSPPTSSNAKKTLTWPHESDATRDACSIYVVAFSIN